MSIIFKPETFVISWINNNSIYFESILTDEEKFIIFMTNITENVMRELARFIFNGMKIRETVIQDSKKNL